MRYQRGEQELRERCILLEGRSSEAEKKRQWRRTIERSAGQRIPWDPIATRYSVCVCSPLACRGEGIRGPSRRRDRWEVWHERGRHGRSGSTVTSLMSGGHLGDNGS